VSRERKGEKKTFQTLKIRTNNAVRTEVRNSCSVPLHSLARVLSVSSVPEDHLTLRRILDDPWWRISTANGCLEAIARITRERMAIVICESDLSDGSWRDVLQHVDEYFEPPALIVTSRLANEHLWAEVLNLGGYDILTKPFDELEVSRVLTSLWMGRKIRARPA
jgi:DNA-binding response OmpR family regulator